MAKKRRPVGRVKDIDGVLFEVAEYRGTTHGFDVVLGWVEGKKKGWYGGAGRSQTVLTAPLARYLTRFRMRPGKMTLPIGQSAIGKLRERLGFHLRKDIRRWWEERRQDLAELSGSEFAAKHGMTPGAAHYTHRILLGHKHRPKLCWKAPESVAILSSDRTDSEIAAALQISASSVRRLRSQSRRDGLVASAGHQRKPDFWWKAPEVQGAIFSGRPDAEIGETSTAGGRITRGGAARRGLSQ